MDDRSTRVAKLNASAHSAAELLRTRGVVPGPSADQAGKRTLAQALRSATPDPLSAVFLEREWLRNYCNPFPSMENYADSLASIDISEEDMVAHLGPNWPVVLDRASALTADEFHSLAAAVEGRGPTESYDVTEYRDRAVSMGLQQAWHNSQLIVDAFKGNYLGGYLAGLQSDVLEIRSAGAYQGALLLRQTIARALVE